MSIAILCAGVRVLRIGHHGEDSSNERGEQHDESEQVCEDTNSEALPSSWAEARRLM